MATDTIAFMDFEKNVKMGEVVTIRWTSCGYNFKGKGIVHKINRESFRVALLEEVLTPLGKYPTGQVLKAPRLTLSGSGGTLWSENNRIEPVGGY